MNNEMTTDNMSNEEVIDILKGIVFNGFDRTTVKERQALDLAIKALEIVDDVKHKVYRNENCPQKHKCYDYQGYHCAGCSWEKKGGTEE